MPVLYERKKTRTCAAHSCNTVRGVDCSFENRVEFTAERCFLLSQRFFKLRGVLAYYKIRHRLRFRSAKKTLISTRCDGSVTVTCDRCECTFCFDTFPFYVVFFFLLSIVSLATRKKLFTAALFYESINIRSSLDNRSRFRRLRTLIFDGGTDERNFRDILF